MARTWRLRAPRKSRKMILLCQTNQGKALKSGLIVPPKGMSVDRRCPDCELLAKEIVLQAHDKIGGTREEWPETKRKTKEYVSAFANPKCERCNGTGTFRDKPVADSHQFRGFVLSCGENVSMLRPGHLVEVPKRWLPRQEYCWDPRLELGMTCERLLIEGDDGTVYEWENGMALVFTREDFCPWLVIGGGD